MSTVEDFFAQHDDWPWNPPRPGRATFHYLIAVSEGALRHDVDHSRFVDVLELHFRELHRAADYADLLGCSVRTLSRAAREATGKGVRELIDERRLLEARRLLGRPRCGRSPRFHRSREPRALPPRPHRHPAGRVRGPRSHDRSVSGARRPDGSFLSRPG
ncbi:helix-turn-helix domain-containing protein [Streptomyces sp. NPDC050600]|uniref:helix-turn-helix domain-containing protein n=1 Tax=Streptomyces sp. NPDC050600 TaxID=3157213 RepID=UPI00342A1CAC